MNSLRGVYTIWYRDILRFWHDKMRMMGAITLPLLFLVVFGSGLSSRMGFLGPGIDFSKFMFPGVIGMTVLMSSFMAGVSVVWDREFGFLKEVLVAPITRASVAVGKTLGAATVAIIQGTLVMLCAPLIGVSISIWVFLSVLPMMFLLAASMGSLGVLLATRIRTMEAFQAVTQMLMFPMMFLSGVFFPLQGLPTWMSILVKINPATYGIAAIRQVVLGTSSDSPFAISLWGHTMSVWNDISVLAVFGSVVTIMAMWSFNSHE
ncbi:ABC transporter permease [Chloroflexota bacterium]